MVGGQNFVLDNLWQMMQRGIEPPFVAFDLFDPRDQKLSQGVHLDQLASRLQSFFCWHQGPFRQEILDSVPPHTIDRVVVPFPVPLVSYQENGPKEILWLEALVAGIRKKQIQEALVLTESQRTKDITANLFEMASQKKPTVRELPGSWLTTEQSREEPVWEIMGTSC